MRIELVENASPELLEAVQMHLREYNRAANPDWYAARSFSEPLPLQLFAFAESGAPLGGLLAETQFLWLKISILVVLPDFRRQGLGQQLMQKAESIALARGCRLAYLDTMEYQAPRFYEKLGYSVVGRLDNWDSHGHAKLFMTKELSQQALDR